MGMTCPNPPQPVFPVNPTCPDPRGTKTQLHPSSKWTPQRHQTHFHYSC